jgi:hypothetical protein
MNNLKDNSQSQKKTAKTEEAQSNTEIKYKKRTNNDIYEKVTNLIIEQLELSLTFCGGFV